MNMATRKLNFLITGAGRGIGRGLSRQLLAAGHRVFMVDNNPIELSHTYDGLRETYGRDVLLGCLADVSKADNIAKAVAEAWGLFHGKLDCLINNAAYTGGVGGMKFDELTRDEWQKSLDVNLSGPVFMTQACLPMLRAARGCVIHMSSTRAFQAEPHHEAYSTTKAGLVGLMQSMAVSLAPDVRCSAILPGWIHVLDECKEADEQGVKWEDGLTREDGRWQLTGRVGRVEDVTRAVVYLAGSEGVTGVEMVVDGGVTRKMVYPD